MKSTTLYISCILVFLLTCSIVYGEELRLLKFSEMDPGSWHSMEEVVQLRQKKINFFDITEYQNKPVARVPTPPKLPDEPTQQKVADQLISQISVANMQSNIEILSSYHTRYYTTQTGVDAAQWIYQTLVAYSSERKSVFQDVDVEYFQAASTNPQPSVIARIYGTQSTDLVIVGCHLDSIHLGAIGRSPGADDDGSGVATLLEIFRVLMNNDYFPNRTLEFHFYAAEEVGLRGSEAVANQYADNNAVVVGMMQFDMVLYPGQNNENLIAIVTDFTNPDLSQFTRKLVDAYSSIGWINTQCGYGCSDHASWTYAGYRAVFPFESQFDEINPDIHTADDTLANADWEHAVQFTKLGMGFVVELCSTSYLGEKFIKQI